MKTYKVLKQGDHWFSGKVDQDTLERVLNEHAREGWVFRSMSVNTTAQTMATIMATFW